MNFLKSNILILFIANSANLFAYLYQFLMGRYLSVESFGILTSVNSLGSITAALFISLPYIISKYIIELKHDKELVSTFLRNMYYCTIYVMLIISGLGIVFIDNIAEYLNLNDHLPIYIYIGHLFSFVLLSVFFGVMQGLLMYINVSIKGALLTFLKLLLSIIIVVLLGYSYNGALFASFLANIIVGFWVYFIVIKHISLKKINNKTLPKGTYKKIAKYTFPTALTWLVIGLITNIDMVLVKHYMSALDAGEYSVASVIAKITVFLPGVLLSVLFPQVSQNNVDGKSSLGTLLTVMGLTVILSFGFSFVIYLFPEFIISLLFGEKYIGSSDVLVVITFAMAIISVISVLFNFLLAKHIYGFLYITSLVIASFSLIIFEYMHESPMQIALAILYACFAIIVSNVFYLLYLSLKRKI